MTHRTSLLADRMNRAQQIHRAKALLGQPANRNLPRDLFTMPSPHRPPVEVPHVPPVPVMEARDLILGRPGQEWGVEEDSGTLVVRDAPRANDPADVDPSSERAQAAQEQLEANAEAEAAALEKLTPEEQQQYLEVKEATLAPGEGRPEGDPVAALALQAMLLDGRLPGDEALGGDQNLLESLHALTTAPLADDIDRDALISDVVQEVAFPECIAQNGPSCTVTTAAIALCLENPAEYVRVVTDLASPEGRAELAGGQVITRDDNGLNSKTNTTASMNLWGPAMMEEFNRDRDYDVNDEEGYRGLGLSEVDRMMEALWGRQVSSVKVGEDVTSEDLTDRARDGESFSVCVEWSPKEGAPGESNYHQILVTGTYVKDGVEYVTFINPWGTRGAMTVEEFEERVTSASSPARTDA